MKRFEVHCFTKQNYQAFGNKFPENSYLFDDEEAVINCLANLLANKESGIYKTELVINKEE